MYLVSLPGTQELVGRVDFFEHLPSVRVFVRMVLLGHLEVRLPDLALVNFVGRWLLALATGIINNKMFMIFTKDGLMGQSQAFLANFAA